MTLKKEASSNMDAVRALRDEMMAPVKEHQTRRPLRLNSLAHSGEMNPQSLGGRQERSKRSTAVARNDTHEA